MKFLHVSWFVGAFPLLLAAQSGPTAYTVTQVNSMFGPEVTMTIYRDGNRALIDNQSPGTHVRALYDLTKSSNQSWDADKPADCGNGSFKGEWGDPFEMSKSLMNDIQAQKPKETGAETVNGFRTKVLETAGGAQGSAKVWIEPQSGLIIRAVFSAPGQPSKTLIETKSFVAGRPPATVFQLPVSCSNTPPPPARAVAGSAGSRDFLSAIRPGPGSESPSCAVVIRALRAGTYEPVTGLQMFANTNIDINNRNAPVPPGAVRQLVRPFRIDNAPPYFDIRARFPDGGEATALIYRQCFGPRMVLLLLLKNPERAADGAEWVWVTSGKLSQ